MEPTTSSSAAFALSKLWLGAGGAVGSGAVGALWQPAALKGYGKVTKGIIIGGIGVATPVVVGGFVMAQFGLDPYSADVGMFVGFCMSLISLLFYVVLTNYFRKHEDKDLFEVVQDARDKVRQVSGEAKPKAPAKKVAAKKAPAKKAAAK